MGSAKDEMCARCGHPRSKHYFEDLSEGAAFPCCYCPRFIPPGEPVPTMFQEVLGSVAREIGKIGKLYAETYGNEEWVTKRAKGKAKSKKRPAPKRKR